MVPGMMATMDGSASNDDENALAQGESEDGAGPQLSLALRVALALALSLLTAATCWLFGHLPWVLSGFSWPTTRAAPIGSSTEGLAGVRLTIPLVAAFLPSLIANTLIGSVAAALLPLVLTTRADRRLPAVAVVLVSLAVMTTIITVLARNTIEAHAADAFAGDPRVLRGLVLVVAGSTVAGALLGVLASVQIGFLPLAAALAAGQLPVWVDGFLVDHDHGVDAVRTAEQVSNGVAFLMLTVAFVLSVRRSAAWMLLWPVTIAIFWVSTPFRIMTSQLASQLRPSSGLPHSFPAIVQDGFDVFRASFWEAHQARWPWLLAMIVALVWMAVERGLRRAGDQ